MLFESKMDWKMKSESIVQNERDPYLWYDFALRSVYVKYVDTKKLEIVCT